MDSWDASLADLDRAIDLEVAALARTPADSHDYPRRLGNLANRLATRYALRGDPADLDRAVDLQEAARHRTPADSPDRKSTRLNSSHT